MNALCNTAFCSLIFIVFLSALPPAQAQQKTFNEPIDGNYRFVGELANGALYHGSMSIEQNGCKPKILSDENSHLDHCEIKIKRCTGGIIKNYITEFYRDSPEAPIILSLKDMIHGEKISIIYEIHFYDDLSGEGGKYPLLNGFIDDDSGLDGLGGHEHAVFYEPLDVPLRCPSTESVDK